MYDFRDLGVYKSDENKRLPAEALSVNGEWLDEVIEGFRTLSVSGRELLARETTNQKVGNADGELFIDSTHPKRTIIVKYQLIAKTATDFREQFYLLSEKIDTPNAQLIFNDDLTVYFIGTHVGSEEPQEGRLQVTGTIEWECSDPCAYAVNEKIFKNDTGDHATISFRNEGNYPAFVDFKSTFKNDNGFIAGTLNGRVAQIGNIQQADGVKYDDAEVLIPGDPQPDPSTGQLNDVKFVTVPTDQWKPVKQGTVALMTPESRPENRILIQSTTGAAPAERKPVETSITYKIPKDKTTGTEGAKSFSFRAQLGFHSYDPFDSGQIVMTVHKQDGSAIASILMQDLYVGKEDYVLQYHVDNQKVYEVNPNIWMLNTDYPHYAIVKYEEKITLITPWKAKTINAPQLKDVEAYYVSFSFLKWFPYATPKIYEVTNWNFWEGYANLFHDTPNYFKKDDFDYFDSAKYSNYINGMVDNSMLAIGSQPLIAKTGDNNAGFIWSAWVPKENYPEIELHMRERWI